MKINYKFQIVMYIVMVIVGMMFNPMNVLAFRLNDLYLSLTLFYGGLLMASNMIWAHEIVHVIAMGKMNYKLFIFGILLSISITIFLLRKQFIVDDKQWLKRMISHHSTALTTSHNIYKKTNDPRIKKLSKEIIDTQEREISEMKSMI